MPSQAASTHNRWESCTNILAGLLLQSRCLKACVLHWLKSVPCGAKFQLLKVVPSLIKHPLLAVFISLCCSFTSDLLISKINCSTHILVLWPASGGSQPRTGPFQCRIDVLSYRAQWQNRSIQDHFRQMLSLSRCEQLQSGEGCFSLWKTRSLLLITLRATQSGRVKLGEVCWIRLPGFSYVSRNPRSGGIKPEIFRELMWLIHWDLLFL